MQTMIALMHMVRKAPPPKVEPLWSSKRVAEYLDKHEDTVRMWRTTGYGPRFLKLPTGRILYRPEDVEAWLDLSVRISTSDDGQAR